VANSSVVAVSDKTQYSIVMSVVSHITKCFVKIILCIWLQWQFDWGSAHMWVSTVSEQV